MQAATDPYWKGKIEELYRHNVQYGDHKPAPDFSYKDVNGHTVTLQQLRGKYVYIDVWATWCGPCKMEIPFLKELAQAYTNKNIQFLGLSIDKTADRDRWAAFVAGEHLAGIQVLADREWESEFVKDFAIQGIPRFILIDPEGTRSVPLTRH